MPPSLAAALTATALFLLFRRDRRNPADVSSAIWIPFWWVLIACSREVSEWLQLFRIPTPGGTLEGGSPVDRLFYLALIVLGLNVLRKRNLRLGDLASQNIALILFLVYCLLSVAWSEYPFVSLKRWIKVAGHPVMALIILTELHPKKAFVQMLRWNGYVLVLVSVLFIKYFPEYGRTFSFWTGQAANTGITTNKNMLGINCLILGFYYNWQLLLHIRAWSSTPRAERYLTIVFLLLNVWLIKVADSKTPLVGLTLGTSIAIAATLPWVRPGLLGFYMTAGALAFWLLDQAFGLYEGILHLFGRNATLTDRTELWADLLRIEINPWIGTGFESFWLGERLEQMWKLWAFRPNQAHNGYLETYLNLGYIGLGLMLLLLVATFFKSQAATSVDRAWGAFRMGFLVAIILYNWTEAAFKTTHPIFFMFYIISIDYATASMPLNRRAFLRRRRRGSPVDAAAAATTD